MCKINKYKFWKKHPENNSKIDHETEGKGVCVINFSLKFWGQVLIKKNVGLLKVIIFMYY